MHNLEPAAVNQLGASSMTWHYCYVLNVRGKVVDLGAVLVRNNCILCGSRVSPKDNSILKQKWQITVIQPLKTQLFKQHIDF